MSVVDCHAVQTFVEDRKGALLQGRLITCDNPDEAQRVAEQKVSRGEAIGAVALTRTVVDPDYDDGSEPITLAVFGKVPPGLADQLPF